MGSAYPVVATCGIEISTCTSVGTLCRWGWERSGVFCPELQPKARSLSGVLWVLFSMSPCLEVAVSLLHGSSGSPGFEVLLSALHPAAL